MRGIPLHEIRLMTLRQVDAVIRVTEVCYREECVMQANLVRAAFGADGEQFKDFIASVRHIG